LPVSSSDITDILNPTFRTLRSPPKATLNLFQDGGVVYGTGVLILDPKTNLEVAAGGTVIGDKMNLDMISLGNVSFCSISMTVIGNSASGTYTAYRPDTPPSGGPQMESDLRLGHDPK
jgi:hypothetical protein